MGSNGGASGGGGGDSCGGELFQSTKVQANFLIMLDHSGSMAEDVNGQKPAPAGSSKWDLAAAAVRQVTSKYNDQIRFGFATFSIKAMACEEGHVIVPVGDMTASQISAQIPTEADGSYTAIAGALRTAGMHQALQDTTRANYVMLLTDGNENCAKKAGGGNDLRAPVRSAAQLATANIKTFVVGFGGAVDKMVLNDTAVAGGTARNTTPFYYQADDQTTLESAFDSIAKGAIGCAFKLAKAPPVPDKVSVYVNGQLIPRDTNKRIGWDFNGTAFDRISLYGTVCDAVANNPSAKVQIVYGCPGGIIEAPGDGGTINLDAGIAIN
jgi:hypothetical protein